MTSTLSHFPAILFKLSEALGHFNAAKLIHSMLSESVVRPYVHRTRIQLHLFITISIASFSAMDRFFFHRDEYDRLYNCSGRSAEEWKSYGHRSIPLGVVYIALGTLYEVNALR